MEADAADRPFCVFLVDDDERLLRVMRIALDAYLTAARVLTFTDPHEAFLSTHAVQPDAVVTDYQMPGCTGAELARALRTALGDECPRLLLVTGELDIPRGERALFDAVYEKPLSPRHLSHHLRSLRPSGRSGTLSAVEPSSDGASHASDDGAAKLPHRGD